MKHSEILLIKRFVCCIGCSTYMTITYRVKMIVEIYLGVKKPIFTVFVDNNHTAAFQFMRKFLKFGKVIFRLSSEYFWRSFRKLNSSSLLAIAGFFYSSSPTQLEIYCDVCFIDAKNEHIFEISSKSKVLVCWSCLSTKFRTAYVCNDISSQSRNMSLFLQYSCILHPLTPVSQASTIVWCH